MRMAAVLGVIGSLLAPAVSAAEPARATAAGSAHSFSFDGLTGDAVALSDFAGKAVLVVNTASRCGFTPQYEGLQALWSQYRDRGLVVLGVPANDFGRQEPGTAEEIADFCEVNFGIDFPMADKTVVVGADRHPFYAWAEQALGDAGVPKWNFHKILIGADGMAVAAFPSRTAPDSRELKSAVEAALPTGQ